MFGFNSFSSSPFSSSISGKLIKGTSANILVVLGQAYGAHGVSGVIITNIGLTCDSIARVEEYHFIRGFFASI